MAKKKAFRLKASQIRRLIPPMAACFASDRITVDGARVGVMMREADDQGTGWTFLAGDETQEYLDDPNHVGLYEPNTIANYDPTIIPYLYALPGQRFGRGARAEGFVEAPDSKARPELERIPQGMSVVQGHSELEREWTIELDTPFRRRREDDCTVLWRPCLTFWIGVEPADGRTPQARLDELLNASSPDAFERRTEKRGGLLVSSYRLVEDETQAGLPSLYTFIVGPRGAVRVSAYMDREEELAAAMDILRTVGTGTRVRVRA